MRGCVDAFLVRLRAARERAGLTQWEAARRLGKHQSYISKSEAGERRVDAVEGVTFAALYGVSLDDLRFCCSRVHGQVLPACPPRSPAWHPNISTWPVNGSHVTIAEMFPDQETIH